MAVFMLGGTTYRMAEESLAFYALIIAAMIALRYDALTGVAVILLGCGIGTLASTNNPFATGIASAFAGVLLADGLVGRGIMLVVGGGIGIWYVMRYAARVQANPSASLVHHLKEDNERHFLKRQGGESDDVPALTGSGLINLVTPTFAVVAGGLALGRVPLNTWWRFTMPLVLMLAGVIVVVYQPAS